MRSIAVLWVVTTIACRGGAGEERALGEALVGHAATGGLTVDVTDGLGAIRELAPGRLTLWASAPTIEVTLTATTASRWQLTIENALPDAALTSSTLTLAAPAPRPRPTVLVQDVDVAPGRHTLTLTPPDDADGPFRFVAMADIQTALPTVDEVFREIATLAPPPRFVVFMGDLTERGELAEYDLAATQLATLPIPFYPTLGNHELWADSARYRERYGRSSYQFRYRGVAFTFVDSGDAGLEPLVEDQLDAWLAAAADRVHVFLTHFPPIDPSGIRDGSFRSRRDAHRLLATLAAGGVDLTLYGHVHTFVAFENAGIPAFISGGGGAQPERWDGIGRHFLVVDAAADQKPTVGLRRVD
jgi:Icc-related predicted phosphoesterase